MALAALLTPVLAAPVATAGGVLNAPDRGNSDWVGGPEGGGARAPAPRAAATRVYQGQAFDTCHTPSLATMDAWLESPYGAVGIYYGGRGRYCSEQPNLDRDWVTAVRGDDWEILPIYVGSQAPCVFAENKQHVTIGAKPAEEGAEEGMDAVQSAAALGIKQGSALYLDMEAYDYRDSGCADTTLAFVRAWSSEVARQGYLPGFYSSAGWGVRHMENARKQGVTDLPEVIWFARWQVPPNVDDEPELPADAWTPHRRIHQYAGDVTEGYGGQSMSIDRNLVDAPVAVTD